MEVWQSGRMRVTDNHEAACVAQGFKSPRLAARPASHSDIPG